MLDEAAILELLRSTLTHRGAQSKLAEELGVSDAYISMVLSGVKRPGPKILSFLGVERQSGYALKSRRRNGNGK